VRRPREQGVNGSTSRCSGPSARLVLESAPAMLSSPIPPLQTPCRSHPSLEIASHDRFYQASVALATGSSSVIAWQARPPAGGGACLFGDPGAPCLSAEADRDPHLDLPLQKLTSKGQHLGTMAPLLHTLFSLSHRSTLSLLFSLTFVGSLATVVLPCPATARRTARLDGDDEADRPALIETREETLRRIRRQYGFLEEKR
jgi:hypothetical protein